MTGKIAQPPPSPRAADPETKRAAHSVYLTTALEFPVPGSKASGPNLAPPVAEDVAELRQKLAAEIARREAAEDVLRETEQWFDQLTTNIGRVCWVTDPDKKRLIYISPGHEKLWSYTRERSYFSPQEWLASLRIAALNERLGADPSQPIPAPAQKEYQLVDSDGTMRWIRDRTFPIYDDAGKLVRLFGIAEDVTENKRMEDALLRNEWRTRALLSVTRDWVVRVRKDGTILECNGRGERSNFSTDLVGRKLIEFLPASLAAEAVQSVELTLQSNAPQIVTGQLRLSDCLREFEARMAVSGTDEVLAVVREMTGSSGA